MPKSLPIRDILTGLLKNILLAIKFWLHSTLVALSWLAIVPLTACRIYRCLFAGSVSSLLTLPLDMLSTENILVDIIQGGFVVLCSLAAFISLVWLREQILTGGGPDWLENVQPNQNVNNNQNNVNMNDNINNNNNNINNNAGVNQNVNLRPRFGQPVANVNNIFDFDDPEEAMDAPDDMGPGDGPLFGANNGDDNNDNVNNENIQNNENNNNDNNNNNINNNNINNNNNGQQAANEDNHWNPMEWDRAAEDLTWDRVGLFILAYSDLFTFFFTFSVHFKVIRSRWFAPIS
jgi:E3 ubiquitin-protein ligase MARCH6